MSKSLTRLGFPNFGAPKIIFTVLTHFFFLILCLFHQILFNNFRGNCGRIVFWNKQCSLKNTFQQWVNFNF